MKNKKNNKIITGIIALSIFALLGGSLLAAQASSPNNNHFKRPIRQANIWHSNRYDHLAANQRSVWKEREAGSNRNQNTNNNFMFAKQKAISIALSNNDYQAWVKAVGINNPITQKITSTNFSQYVQAYNLMQEAHQKMTNLGLNYGPSSHNLCTMMGSGMMANMRSEHGYNLMGN